MAIDHYENFPVASILLPAHLRAAVHTIYRYARSADDIADEGDALPQERLHQLERYRFALEQIRSGEPLQELDPDLKPIFVPLAGTIAQHTLPLQPFMDLLSAFEQDVSVTRYKNNAELMDYCRRSANPVGHLMLHLYNAVQTENLKWADAICTGLQLTNFWQDVAIDWTKDRVYIPQDTLHAHHLDDSYIAANAGRTSRTPSDDRWQALMQQQVQQARELLLQGQPLGRRLKGRPGYELRMIVQGGLRILQRLDQLHYDVFFRRPTLRKRDWLLLIWRAL